jgi:hypothetical protein
MSLSNSWKSFYDSLPGPTTRPAMLRYAAILPSAAAADDNRQVTNVTITPHCAILVKSASKKVKILHHFYSDTKTPLDPDGTEELWCLLGSDAPAHVISLPSSFQAVKTKIPRWEDLSGANNAAAIRKLPPATRDATTIQCLSGIALPPFLTSVLMGVKSEDPAILCSAACKAIHDWDALHGTEFGDENSTPGADSYYPIAGFLWAASQKDQVPSCHMEPESTGRAADWSTSFHEQHLTGIRRPGENPPNNNNTSGNEALTRVAAALTAQTEAFVSSSESREATKSDPHKKWKQLAPVARKMILFASARTETGTLNTDGDDISGTVRKEPVEHLLTLIEAASAGTARQIADSILQDTLRCTCNIPDSTIQALRDGMLRWKHPQEHGRLSIFSCGPYDPTRTVELNDIADPFELQLAVTEGKGLSPSQVSQTTKIVRQVPSTVYEMTAFLNNFDGLLQLTFGRDSRLRRSIKKWIEHVFDNELKYHQLAAGDPLFCTKLLAYIDGVIQTYLVSCGRAETEHDCETELLTCFGHDRVDIVTGRFHMGTLPTVLLTAHQATTGSTESAYEWGT